MNSAYRVAQRFLKGSFEETSVIRKEKGEFCVRSPNNPDWNGVCYDTEGKAKKRLQEVEYFKRHAKEIIAERIGDPKAFLAEYERAVESLVIPPGTLLSAKKILEAWEPGKPWTPVEANAGTVGYSAKRHAIDGQRKVNDPGHKLFLSILQTYTLPPALRKKVEMASRLYLKETNPRFKNRGLTSYLEYIRVYEKYMALLQAHLATAKEAIAKGKEHSEGGEGGEGATKMKVGPFTLVNTGGFSEKQMQEVADVVQKVTAYAQSSGVGDVCYGEIQVTNTISQAKTLAFYLIASDEMFIRANVKGTTDTVQVVLHELGHRYDRKFLKDKNGPAVLYRILEGQERSRKWDAPKKMPKPNPGDTLKSKGKTYVVTQVLPDYKAGFKVYLSLEGQPSSTATVPLEGFWELKGEKSRKFEEDPEYIGFVTNYAKTGGPGENFAEMFSYYCLGKLPVKQSVPFEQLLFEGTIKTASRVLERYRQK